MIANSPCFTSRARRSGKGLSAREEEPILTGCKDESLTRDLMDSTARCRRVTCSCVAIRATSQQAAVGTAQLWLFSFSSLPRFFQGLRNENLKRGNRPGQTPLLTERHLKIDIVVSTPG